MQAKRLVTVCGVRSVPALHIYARGALVEALSANPKKWAAIEARLEKVSAGFVEGVRHVEETAPYRPPKAQRSVRWRAESRPPSHGGTHARTRHGRPGGRGHAARVSPQPPQICPPRTPSYCEIRLFCVRRAAAPQRQAIRGEITDKFGHLSSATQPATPLEPGGEHFRGLTPSRAPNRCINIVKGG